MDNLMTLVGAVTAAGLISGMAGFGVGLVSMALLATVLPLTQATALVSILTVINGIPVLWTVRRAVRWRELWPLLVGAAPAVIVGVYLLRVLDAAVLRAGVLAMILASCAVTVWSPKRALLARALPWGAGFGALSGVFDGALGMGGPPVVFYTLLRNWDKTQTKATLCALFLALNIWRTALLTFNGVSTWETYRLGAMLAAPLLLASTAGVWLFKRMNTAAFRYAVMAMLLGLAVKLLA